MNWDLQKLYSSLEEWEKDFKLVEETINYMGTFQGKLNNYDMFLEYYKTQKELGVTLLKVYQYAALTSDLNKKDTDNAARVQRMSFLLSKLNQTTAFEAPEILSIGKKTIMEFVEKNDLLKEYTFSINKLFRNHEHVLDNKSESLLANYSQLSGQGSEIYSALSVADKTDKEVTLSSGEKVVITSGNYRSYLADLESPEDRKVVFEAIFGQYKDHKNAYAQIYNTVLQRDIANMKNRKYNSSLESYLFSNNIPMDVYKKFEEVLSSEITIDKIEFTNGFLNIYLNEKYVHVEYEFIFFLCTQTR